MISDVTWVLVCTFGKPRFNRDQIHQRLLRYLNANPDVEFREHVCVLNVMVRILDKEYTIPTTGMRQLDWHETIHVGDICHLTGFFGQTKVSPIAAFIGITVDEAFYRWKSQGVLQVFRTVDASNKY